MTEINLADIMRRACDRTKARKDGVLVDTRDWHALMNLASKHVEPATEDGAAVPDYWAVHSKTMMHVGLWHHKETADRVARNYGDNYIVTPLYAASPPPPVSSEVVGKLVEALKEAREDILSLKNSRWSESEATDAEAVGYIDAVLALVEEVG